MYDVVDGKYYAYKMVDWLNDGVNKDVYARQ